jgi:tetratricopeptide (TPR) repeat protein
MDNQEKMQRRKYSTGYGGVSAAERLLLMAALLCAAACSTKKNTWMSRTYHNITSEFNVKFNGNESFKDGVRKADRYMPEEYEQLPPVFVYEYKEIPGKVSGEMDRAIEKCEKLVLKHSITVKPDKKPASHASRKEREFYDRTEFNSVVDDAYLLSGKAHLYLHEYDKARLFFEHLLKEYPKSSSAPEARIQLAGALLQLDDLEQAEKLLTAAGKDKQKLSKTLNALLDATYAALYIRQNNHRAAAAHLINALSQETKKANKIRYYFILTELYRRAGRYDDAAMCLDKITQLHPSYGVVFAVQMRKAIFYNPQTQGTTLKDELHHMLDDGKNQEYHDQIYFALAQVEQLSGNDSLATGYLQKSIAAESSNEHQKALAYIMYAGYAHAGKRFAEAYTAYTNALTRLSPDYPQYDSLERTANGLQRLAENSLIIQREDSLQRIAAMPAAEREQWIAGLIAKITAAEEQRRQEQRQQQYFMYQEEYSRNTGQQAQSNAWYFYNISSVNSGLSSFNMRWGKRKLEDDWRRKNKHAVVFSAQAETQSVDSGEPALSNKSPEYYTRDLPLTPEKLEASNERLSNALFRLGEAYKDDVHEPAAAIATFRTLDSRFPQNDNRASVYYYLYALYTETAQPDSAEYYKQQLVTHYPKTPLAQQLTNPNYFAEQQAEKAAMDAQYEKVFEAYNARQYAEAGALAQQMIERYPNSLLEPQLDFIHAVSVGAGGDIAAYKSALATVIRQHPSSDIAKTAAEMIARLEKQELQYTLPDNEPAPADAPAAAPATATETTPYLFSDKAHYAGFICEQSKDTAALLFALESYNADAYIDKNLEVVFRKIGENYVMALVRAFPALPEAKSYMDALEKSVALENFPPQEYRKVLITPDNLELLIQSKDIAAYLNFFTKNYLQP